ncbi:unnamed protein product, partial [Prunus brigantina]
MNSELQKQHEHMDCANDMIAHLQELYGEGTRNRRFSAVSEKTFKKESGSGIVAAFEKGSSSSTKPKPKTKGNGKGKEKKTTVVKPKGKITKKKAKEPKGICFYCNENG